MQQHSDDRISAEIKRLQRPLGGRRLLSWTLFLIALAVCLLLPVAGSRHAPELKAWIDKVPAVAQYVNPQIDKVYAALNARRHDPTVKAPATRKTHDDQTQTVAPDAYVSPPPTVLALDRVWNPGPLAAAHQSWAHDCKVCHSAPFTRVMDKDCKTCHATIGDHVPAAAGAVHGISDQRCADCHHDHQGSFALAAQNLHYTGRECADCHRNIKLALPATHTEDVADFADKHPEFRVQVAAAPPESTLSRVRPATGEVLREPTGLKFPHDVHLSEKGIDSPQGEVRMECANCHVLKQDGLAFEPVNMKDHCASCHALKLEPAMSNREVPHGNVAEVLTAVREFYTYVEAAGGLPPEAQALTHTIKIVRPGEPERPVQSFLKAPGNARERAAAAATELFEKTSCVVCHEVSRDGGPGLAATPGQDLPQWKIAPVQVTHTWMPKSVFNHASHASEACTDCHAAQRSDKAEQVLMPQIAVCRDCHAGATPVANKVTSDCGLCHGFHLPARLPPPTSRTAPLTLSVIKTASAAAAGTTSP